MSRAVVRKRKPYYAPNSSFNQKVQTVGNVARTATAAMGAAKLALSLINPEFKYKDVDTTTASVSTTHFIQLLNGLSLGTTASTRVGQSVKNVSIEVGILVTRNTASTTNNFLRCCLILDKNANGAAPTAANIFEAPAANPILSPRNLSFRNRFVCLKDWTIDIGNAGNRPSVHMSKFRKLNLHTTYNTGNAGTVADIAENALYLVYVSDATTNAPQLTFYSRIRYLDN